MLVGPSSNRTAAPNRVTRRAHVRQLSRAAPMRSGRRTAMRIGPIRIVTTGLLCVVSAGVARAGGLSLYEVDTADVGLESAGYGARAQDASTVLTRLAGEAYVEAGHVRPAQSGFRQRQAVRVRLGCPAGAQRPLLLRLPRRVCNHLSGETFAESAQRPIFGRILPWHRDQQSSYEQLARTGGEALEPIEQNSAGTALALFRSGLAAVRGLPVPEA